MTDHPTPLSPAALARWGRPVPPPAEGEVEELVRRLRYAKQNGNSIPSGIHWGLDDGIEHQGSIYVGSNHAADCSRAADLLQRLQPVQPVAVSERLPGPEDCDGEGRCWLLTVEDDYPQWRLHSIQGAQPGGAMIWVPVDSSPGVMVDCFYTSHWLPAHALTVPTHTSENV